MNIFYFGDDPFVQTGFGAVNSHLYNELIRQGHTVVFAGRNTNQDVDHPKRIYERGKLVSGYYDIKRGSFPGKALVELLKNNKFDRYIFHEDIALMSLLFFGTTIENFGGISDYIDNTKTMWIGPFDSVIPHKIDKKLIDYVGASFPYTLYGQKTLNATNAFRLGPTVPTSTTIERNSYGTKFLFVGANRYKKKIDILIQAFSAYRAKYCEDAELYIKTEPGNYNNQLFSQDIEGVHVIYDNKGKRITNEEMKNLFTMCDTYVSLCPNEGWGLPLTDATHYNMKIVAVDFPNHGEACGEMYNKIPVYDFFDFDGLRTIPVPDYIGATDMLNSNAVGPNNLKINHWAKSVDGFIDIMEKI